MTLGALNGFMNSVGYGAYNTGFGREAQGTTAASSPMPSRPVMRGIDTVHVVIAGNATTRPASQYPNLRGASLMSGHTIHYNTTYKKFYIEDASGKLVSKGMSGTINVPGVFIAGPQWADRNKPPAQTVAEKKVTEKKLEEAKSSGDSAAIAALTAQIAALTESQAAQSGKTDISSAGLSQQQMLLIGGGAVALVVVVLLLRGGGGRPAYGPPRGAYGPPPRGRAPSYGGNGRGGYKKRRKRK